MVAEITTGIGLLKSLYDAAKGLKDINDTTILNAAVIEFQEKILAAQEQQAALVQTVRELEENMAQMETWRAEAERYELTDYGGGTFAYELKESVANGEPPHRVCANCYQKSQKSILQFKFTTSNQQSKYSCPSCEKDFLFGESVRKPVQPRRSSRSTWRV